MERQIKNFDELATSENRKVALAIAEAGLLAINTENVILNSVKLKNNILSVAGEEFDLARFKAVKIVGFGKSSIDAALALTKVLGGKITEGAVIGLSKVDCGNVETFAGSHPRPTEVNLQAGKRIHEIAESSTEEDLVIAIISGGGSALLCSSEDECEQGAKLYDSFLKSGKTINEINTVRKHLSSLKGGGLAKVSYPATVIGLIFSDVPGDNFEIVASGATYKDNTTIVDAEKIIKESNLGDFDLVETPKEDKYFEKVRNFVLVSNKTAVEAMEKKSKELGLKTKIVSTELYDQVGVAFRKILSAKENNTVVLAAGEPTVEIKDKSGKGGRNMHMGLTAIVEGGIDSGSVFIPLASDGMDNSDVAGAVVDEDTLRKIEKLNLDAKSYLEHFNSYEFFEQTADMVMTGPTGANVSDLMILVTKK